MTSHEVILPLFSGLAGNAEHKRYSTIVADPPWHYGKSGGYSWRKGLPSGESRDLPYPTMLPGEIANMPVGLWAQDNAHLYLWTTQRYLRDAFKVAESWGFEVKKVLVWCKAPTGFSMGGPFGNSSEFVVIGQRGQLAYLNRIPRDWFDWKRGEHSEKPASFYDMVEHMSPGPYLDVFARKQRFRWDTWGNEAFDFREHGVFHADGVSPSGASAK